MRIRKVFYSFCNKIGVKNLHIGICDDEQPIRSYLRTLVKSQVADCTVTEYSSGEEFLQDQREHGFQGIDIVFMDIALKDMDGMEAAKQLRKKSQERQKADGSSLPLFIFVTASPEYMRSAFAIHAFQYILKPVRETEFQAVFRQAVQEYRHMRQDKAMPPKEITVKTKSQVRKIPIEKICYIESHNRKVTVHFDQEQIEYYEKISELERILQPDFFRVHKGYLVHMKYIQRYNRSELYMKNGDVILISKYKYHDFAKAYLRYLSEENDDAAGRI